MLSVDIHDSRVKSVLSGISRECNPRIILTIADTVKIVIRYLLAFTSMNHKRKPSSTKIIAYLQNTEPALAVG